MRRVGQVLAVLGALFALASAYAYGFFARPATLAKLPADLPADTFAAFNAAWIFGGVAMVAFALVVLVLVPRLGRDAHATVPVAIAGLFYLGYGTWATAYRHHSHFIGFIVIGMLILAGAWLATKDSRRV